MTIRPGAGNRSGRVWLIVAAGAVLVVGLGAAFALGAFDGDGTPETTQAAGAEVTTTAAALSTVATTTSGTAATTASTGEDPLCQAHAGLTAALDGHLPVTGPEDLEIVQTALLAFYTEAVDYVDPPERDAFSEFLLYQQASYDHSESFEWNPSPPPEELLDNLPPTPPQEATAVVIQVLEERCDVTTTVE